MAAPTDMIKTDSLIQLHNIKRNSFPLIHPIADYVGRTL